ncbi:MAG: AmmeMemoRadiSam system protein B [Phycisphaerae bacterium]
MPVREPVVAGQFYAAGAHQCRQELIRLSEGLPPKATMPERLIGGIVPHAGWVYSGAVAMEVFRSLAGARQPDVIVVFGGVHRYRSKLATVFGSGRWETPIGSVSIDDRLAGLMLDASDTFVDDPHAHETEHSIEVQMPMVAFAFPDVPVVPIMVPPGPAALSVGEAVGRTLVANDRDAVVVGTTDLTHYGPGYGFTPRGIDADAFIWAKEENDRRYIKMMCAMAGEQAVAEAGEHRNACSSGAVAATIGAAKALGATRGSLLSHTTSREVLVQSGRAQPVDSVGYAGVVLH